MRAVGQPWRAPSSDFLDNGDRTGPAGGAAAHLDRKAAHGESGCRQRFEIVQLLDVAIADLAARLMAFPDQAGIAGGEVFFPRVDERSVPTPAVGAGHAHAAFEQIERRFAAHAATLRDVVGASIRRTGAGVHQHDLERREAMPYAAKLGFDLAGGHDVAVAKMANGELHAGLAAPYK